MAKKIDHSNRAHALLSASSAHRWLNCTPSAMAARLYESQDTAFTREGTLAHEVAEQSARALLDREEINITVEDPITQEMATCARGYAEYIQEQLKGDDAVVLLEQRVDFSDIVPGGFGTADCIILHGDTMDVIDYKYGKGVAVEAEQNEQLKLYGIGALNDFGLAYDVRTINLHIYQPRIHNISVWSIPHDVLKVWAQMLVKPKAALAAKGEGEYLAGDWCRFCPHAGRCKELTETCLAFVEENDVRVGVPVLTPTEVAEVLNMESLVSLWLKRVKSQALTALLEGGEIPGYKAVEGKLGNRKWVNELEVLECLESQGYSREDVTETKLLSPAAMDKVVGRKKAAELLGGLTERAPGAPTIVPEDDKRPPYNPADDFEKID